MKNTIGFIVFVLLVIAFMFAISGKKHPQIPANAKHIGITEISLCLACHGPGKEYPQKPDHPPKSECFKCHKTKRSPRAK